MAVLVQDTLACQVEGCSSTTTQYQELAVFVLPDRSAVNVHADVDLLLEAVFNPLLRFVSPK